MSDFALPWHRRRRPSIVVFGVPSRARRFLASILADFRLRRRIVLRGLLLVAVAVTALLVHRSHPPLARLLHGMPVDRVLVQCGADSTEITDRAGVKRFIAVIRAGDNPLHYGPKCIDWPPSERWSVTLVPRRGSPVEVLVGRDDCGAFYLPAIDCTFTNHELLPLVAQTVRDVQRHGSSSTSESTR